MSLNHTKSKHCDSSLCEQMNKTWLHLSVTPMRPFGVYTHHALLITCISLECSLISPVTTAIKQPYFIIWSHLLIALIAVLLWGLPILFPVSLNLCSSKQRTDICKTMPDIKEGRIHPAVGPGIFTQLLCTEYQVTAGKTFVVPWWGIGVFDLDLNDCLWALATHHLQQLPISPCTEMHGPPLLSTQPLIIYLHDMKLPNRTVKNILITLSLLHWNGP